MKKANQIAVQKKMEAIKNFNQEEFLEFIKSFEFVPFYDILEIIAIAVKTFVMKNDVSNMINMIYTLPRRFHEIALEALLNSYLKFGFRDLALSVTQELRRNLTVSEINKLILAQIGDHLYGVAKETAKLLPGDFSAEAIMKINQEEAIYNSKK